MPGSQVRKFSFLVNEKYISDEVWYMLNPTIFILTAVPCQQKCSNVFLTLLVGSSRMAHEKSFSVSDNPNILYTVLFQLFLVCSVKNAL